MEHNFKELLQSAMGASVNWYFQTIDERLGADSAFGDRYGKTGTGRVNGQDVNSWFIGLKYMEIN